MRLPCSFFTYKGLRTVYAQVCDTLYNPDKKDNMLYLAQILGHGRGDLIRGDNLIDTATPQSYNSDFNVVNIDFKDWNRATLAQVN